MDISCGSDAGNMRASSKLRRIKSQVAYSVIYLYITRKRYFLSKYPTFYGTRVTVCLFTPRRKVRPIMTKDANDQQNCLQISYRNFHPNGIINVQSMCLNSCTVLSEARLLLNKFSRITIVQHHYTYVFCIEFLQKTVKKRGNYRYKFICAPK